MGPSETPPRGGIVRQSGGRSLILPPPGSLPQARRNLADVVDLPYEPYRPRLLGSAMCNFTYLALLRTTG